MKIKICIPFYKDFEPSKSGLRELKNRCEQISEWSFRWKDMTITVEPRQGTSPKSEVRNSYLNDNIPQVRTELIDLSFDRLVFIDSDMIWHFQDLLDILEYDYHVIMFPYVGHADDNNFMCGTWDKPGKNHKLLSAYTTGLFPVAWGGMGFFSVKTEVFKNIETPFFYCPVYTDDKGKRFSIGSDIGFCQNLWGKYKIMCDFDKEIKHQHRSEIDWSF